MKTCWLHQRKHTTWRQNARVCRRANRAATNNVFRRTGVRVADRRRGGPLSAHPAGAAVQRRVRRSHTADHAQPAPQPDLRDERHRFRCGRQRQIRIGVHKLRLRLRHVRVDLLLVALLVDLLPGGRSHQTGACVSRPIRRTKRPNAFSARLSARTKPLNAIRVIVVWGVVSHEPP